MYVTQYWGTIGIGTGKAHSVCDTVLGDYVYRNRYIVSTVYVTVGLLGQGTVKRGCPP